jgi:hypothetical protein
LANTGATAKKTNAMLKTAILARAIVPIIVEPPQSLAKFFLGEQRCIEIFVLEIAVMNSNGIFTPYLGRILLSRQYRWRGVNFFARAEHSMDSKVSRLSSFRPTACRNHINLRKKQWEQRSAR